MKILLFGKNGQVGWELNRSLLPLGEVVALGREEADFSRPESLRSIVRKANPDVIVNAVAYTAVDKAETEEGLAATINGVAPGVLAEEALMTNSLLIHYSTDYVFDGTKEKPYIETDKPNPINAYGRTKLLGEQAVISSGCDYLIFRTSWVYTSRGNNFLLTILKLAKEKDELNVITDQIGSPTSASLIADVTFRCISRATKDKQEGRFISDLYHLAASENTSWHGFAIEIINGQDNILCVSPRVKVVNTIMTDSYPTLAKRPLNSRLDTRKLESNCGITLPNWKNDLNFCLKSMAAASPLNKL